MNKSLNNFEQLQGLIATLEHQDSMKKDFIANSNNHILFVDGQLQVTRGTEKITYEPTNHFHTQVAEKLGIPMPYYRKMLERGISLLDDNVNHWLSAESKNFLIRTFQGASEQYKNTARALLSDSYNIIDNNAILMEALDAIRQTGVKIDVVNAELSDTRMYLKVVAPQIEIDAKEMLGRYNPEGKRAEVGSGIVSGFTLSNSEIGAGAFNIMPRALVLVCGNGATMPQDAFKKIHLGAKMDELEFNKNKRVMDANLKLIREQIQHAVKLFLSKQYLTKVVDYYTALGQPKIEAPVTDVIDVVAKEYSITEDRKANILKYFVDGGDTRRMGLASAMTFECQGLEDADLKHETEVASHDMLKNFDRIEAAAIKKTRSSN